MAKNRRASRRNRSNRRNRSRRNRRNNFVGGYEVSPQELNDTSMLSPQRVSVEQGNQFADLTKSMHGGMGTYPQSVTESALPQPLHASARLLALDQSFNDIKGMRDPYQGGARRKSRKGRKGRKGRKASRKATRKGRKSRRNRRQNGGAALGYAEVNSPGMLLTPEQTARAGLNPEWRMAEDPNSFSPKA